VGVAALKWAKSYPDVRVPLLEKFGDSMLGPDHDTYFFVGNQHLYPQSFLVLGVFYPKL